ncbi:MAG: hypothetical protein AAFO94_02580 [Bacteroidota bacterium]
MRILIFPGVLLGAVFLSAFFGCRKNTDTIIEDYSVVASDEVQLDIATASGAIIPARIEKPEGRQMDVVLLLPDSENEQLEDQMAARYFERGFMVLRLDHNAFFGAGNGAVATQAAIDFLKRDLSQYNIELGKLVVQGSFKSACHAFATALQTKVDAVILNEPTADADIWRQAKAKSKLAGLKAPFLLIAAEEQTDRVRDNLLDLEASYHSCTRCKEGSQFVYHPGTPEDWNQDEIWELIFEFVEG